MKRLIATLAGSALLAFPLAAAAQQDGAPPRPPSTDETIHGTVDSLPDHYTLLLHDDRGFIDTVTLRDQTVVNPAELNLTQGLSITIIGHTTGKVFVADEIDAKDAARPGTASGPPPNPGNDDQGYGDNGPPPPAYQAPVDGPAYESNAVDPGYDVPPDAVYGAPYYGYPGYGVVIGGYYGGYPYYYGGFGYYGGGFYGGYYGGYHGHPYYGSAPGAYYHGGYGNGYVAPGSGRTPQPPLRQAPGSGYPTSSSRAGYGGGSYRAAPQSTYRAAPAHVQSSSRASGGSTHR